jgi:signal transduction histidine kinase
MTTIYGGAELLARAQLPDATRIEAAAAVAVAAEQLHRVVEDLVLLVRWSADDARDTEPVLLQPILRAVDRQPADGHAHIELDMAPDLAPVVGTEVFVRHLVRNLVQHAVANSPAGGRVEISGREEGDWIELRIADEGPVLDDDERDRAFQLFAPTSRQQADPSGANLSLVVARRLVERLGGSIEAGRRDRGGELLVRLPAVREGGLAERL